MNREPKLVYYEYLFQAAWLWPVWPAPPEPIHWHSA